jgi:hypothetical protein
MQMHEEDGDIKLPDISQFTPPKTDQDAADALSTLYLTHVTTLVDCVRFCKEKMFFRLFTQFQGTLTVPVQKLLVHARIAPWVKECDYLMYQRMIRVIAPLTLQVIPPKVMKFLDTISKLLDSHITKTFSALPPHLQDAKLEPATLFSQLLERMLRANQAAHAASMVLIEDEHRNRMWQEYVKFVQPKKMMNAFLPDCGYDEEVYKLLTFDARSLLLPLQIAPSVEMGTHYESAAMAQHSMAQPPTFELDRIGHFLESLKPKFPTVSTRDLLNYIQGVTSYILRDITMERGQSYNGWLITKCFIDELALWLAHAGGFLARYPPPPPPPQQQQPRGPDSSLQFGDDGPAADAMLHAPIDLSAAAAPAPSASNGVRGGSDSAASSSRGSAAPLLGSRYSSAGDEFEAAAAADAVAGAEADAMSVERGAGGASGASGAEDAEARKEMDLDDSGIGLSLDDDVKPGSLAADLAAMHAVASAPEVEMI